MARLSTVDRLKPEVRALIGQLREQGRTIMEIKGGLDLLQVRVSLSALGRHTKKLDASRPAAVAASLEGVRRELALMRAELGELLTTLRASGLGRSAPPPDISAIPTYLVDRRPV